MGDILVAHHMKRRRERLSRRKPHRLYSARENGLVAGAYRTVHAEVPLSVYDRMLSRLTHAKTGWITRVRSTE